MTRLRLLIASALAGAIIAALAVIDTNRTPSTSRMPASIAAPPFASYVAGIGITENGRGNVSVAAPVPGVVREVYVRVGDNVRARDPLFRIDDRDMRARLLVAHADVAQAQTALVKQQHHLDYLASFQQRDRAAVSRETLTSARDDVRNAESTVEVANAAVAQLNVEVERLLVRAPSPGRVLQINIRVGELADSGIAAKPLMLLGDDSRVFLRVDIDENDAWRVRPNAHARASLRGNPAISVPLRFEYVEPYVTPKASLTGQPTERTDQRVLQVIYSFERGTAPIYLGQRMDAFIEAEPAASGSNGQR